MHTDKHINLLLGADPEFLHRLDRSADQGFVSVRCPGCQGTGAAHRRHGGEPLARHRPAPVPGCVSVLVAGAFDHLTLAGILAMLGELTPLERTRDYREIVEKNRLI